MLKLKPSVICRLPVTACNLTHSQGKLLKASDLGFLFARQEYFQAALAVLSLPLSHQQSSRLTRAHLGHKLSPESNAGREVAKQPSILPNTQTEALQVSRRIIRMSQSFSLGPGIGKTP